MAQLDMLSMHPIPDLKTLAQIYILLFACNFIKILV